MDTLDMLTRAIKLQKPISFEYDVEKKVRGIRYGNPHAIFLHPTTNNVMIHIFQTDGVSDTKDEIPGWRSPLLSYIKNIVILEEYEDFIIEMSYKPNSPMYARVIAKI